MCETSSRWRTQRIQQNKAQLLHDTIVFRRLLNPNRASIPFIYLLFIWLFAPVDRSSVVVYASQNLFMWIAERTRATAIIYLSHWCVTVPIQNWQMIHIGISFSHSHSPSTNRAFNGNEMNKRISLMISCTIKRFTGVVNNTAEVSATMNRARLNIHRKSKVETDMLVSWDGGDFSRKCICRKQKFQ